MTDLDAPRFLVLGCAQEREWTAVLSQVAQHDFYHLPAYHRLAEERGEGAAHLFAYQEGFKKFNLGYTSALSFLFLIAITIIGVTYLALLRPHLEKRR